MNEPLDREHRGPRDPQEETAEDRQIDEARVEVKRLAQAGIDTLVSELRQEWYNLTPCSRPSNDLIEDLESFLEDY